MSTPSHREGVDDIIYAFEKGMAFHRVILEYRQAHKDNRWKHCNIWREWKNDEWAILFRLPHIVHIAVVLYQAIEQFLFAFCQNLLSYRVNVDNISYSFSQHRIF